MLFVTLLQRTPVLRVAALVQANWSEAPLGAVMRAAFVGITSLGAVHALAGATTFLVQQGQATIIRDGDPPRVNSPATGTVGSAISPVLFTVIGAPVPPGSFQIRNLPPGLTIPGLNSSGVLTPASTGFITGTPTAAGTFTTTILAFEFPGGPAQLGNNDTVGPITVTFTIAAGAIVPPTFAVQPVSQSVTPGTGVTFAANASGSPPPTYQWRKNGVAILGATAATYTIPNAQPDDAGDYSVVAVNTGGSVTSNPANLAVSVPATTARLSNLSVRTTMAVNQTLIVGIVVNDGARDILVRAAGPALAAFGLSSAMADPRLDLFNGTALVFSNNDWPSSMASSFASVGAFPFANDSRDAAFIQSLNAAYSIQARGTGAGAVLVEAYDTGAPSAARLVNVSARNRVGTGDDILIAGFTISGIGSKQLLIRAIGPKLSAFGVSGVLADPKLEIYNSAGIKLTENDNWTVSLAPTFAAVGAFALDSGSRDAALLTVLPSGSYTVQVRGADGGTGEALIEIYEVP